MRPVMIIRTLATDDADGIAEAQNLVAAGALTLDGALVVAGVAILGAQRRLVFTAGAGDDLSAINFTVVGKDGQGRVATEVLVGPVDATPVISVLDYSEVSSITADDAFPATETVAVGTSAEGASFPVPVDLYLNPVNLSIKVSISGTANVTVQYTNDPIFNSDLVDVEWTDHTDLDNLSSGYTTGTIISPVTAVRLVTNSGTGTATMVVTQSGATG